MRALLLSVLAALGRFNCPVVDNVTVYVPLTNVLVEPVYAVVCTVASGNVMLPAVPKIQDLVSADIATAPVEGLLTVTPAVTVGLFRSFAQYSATCPASLASMPIVVPVLAIMAGPGCMLPMVRLPLGNVNLPSVSNTHPSLNKLGCNVIAVLEV